MLLDQLTVDLHQALKNGDKIRTETLRFLIAAIKKYEIDTYPPGAKGSLTDEEVVRVMNSQVKTHRESITAFEKGNRQDLIDKETAELKVIESYLPKQLSDAEITEVVQKIIRSGLTDFGPLMGNVMAEVRGRASGERVAKIVRQELVKK